MLSSAMSLTMTAHLKSSSSCLVSRICFSRVVLPAPRKPQRSVMGTKSSPEAAVCCQRYRVETEQSAEAELTIRNILPHHFLLDTFLKKLLPVLLVRNRHHDRRMFLRVTKEQLGLCYHEEIDRSEGRTAHALKTAWGRADISY